MKHIAKAAGFAVLMIAVLSCSLAGKLAQKGLDKGLNTHRADSLWDDVPRMDGLNDSPTEDLPVTIKLVLHTFVNMVLNSDKNSKPVSTDWIFFKYNGSESDIENFYTPAKMNSSGNWSLPENMKSACIDGKEKGLPGSACLYQKAEDGKQKGLIIITLPTQEPKAPVFVYFLRAETTADAPTR
jgi:hypothetical protein